MMKGYISKNAFNTKERKEQQKPEDRSRKSEFRIQNFVFSLRAPVN
jgi:hypothetical protein